MTGLFVSSAREDPKDATNKLVRPWRSLFPCDCNISSILNSGSIKKVGFINPATDDFDLDKGDNRFVQN
jgi:hypothetical protein